MFRKKISVILSVVMLLSMSGMVQGAEANGKDKLTTTDTTASLEKDPLPAEDVSATAEEDQQTAENESAPEEKDALKGGIWEPGVISDQESSGMTADESSNTISSADTTFYFSDPDSYMTIPLYFVDDVMDMPYVDLADWLDLMVSAYDYYLGDEGYQLFLETDGEVALVTRENDYSMLLDFSDKTITFEDYNAFTHNSKDTALLDFISTNAVSDDGEPLFFERVRHGSYDRYGKEIKLDLDDYNIDMIWDEESGLYLVPLQTMGDFLISSPLLLNVLYNGTDAFLANADDLSASDDELTPLGELYYSAETGTMSEELAWYSYCELCLAMDCLYGLKEIHDIDTFDHFFTDIGYRERLASTDPAEKDQALAEILASYLDDQHSAFVFFSYFTDPGDFTLDDGLSYSRSYELEQEYREVRAQADQPITSYQEIGNTAYITFDHFNLKYVEDYYNGDYDVEEDPASDSLDPVALILYAHEQINRENSPIENVVLDLSLNTGGTVDAAIAVLGWFLGEAPLTIKDTFTGAQSTSLYKVDTDLNMVYDENDTIADKNLYCLISPTSFSCGNMVPSVFKNSHKVILLGQTSGGGSCSVLNLSTAYGSIFDISSSHRLSMIQNGSYYDIDQGVEPDNSITKPENFYDREALTEYINDLF